ncbi:hypothetical protein Taro_011884 [Colocasia esculenta]|uniref:Uncharacterized protein n=1 Tax=Colocasia esculenta TaxID=4460 RepID=A0A843UHG4_COLES|nr:hypothetical protein [Colocasia esculenta]
MEQRRKGRHRFFSPFGTASRREEEEDEILYTGDSLALTAIIATACPHRRRCCWGGVRVVALAAKGPHAAWLAAATPSSLGRWRCCLPPALPPFLSRRRPCSYSLPSAQAKQGREKKKKWQVSSPFL